MAWKLERMRGWGRNSISKYVFHISWALEVKCTIFWKAALHAIFRWCVTSIRRQSKYCNILLIVNFRTKYIGKDILYFSKKSIDIRHQTYQLHLLKRSVCKPFIFLTLNCLVKFSTQTTTKKCLASTWKQSFDKYLQSVFSHLQCYV